LQPASTPPASRQARAPATPAASVVAGALWDVYGPAATFFAGLVFALVALLGLLTMRGEISRAAVE